MGSDGQSGHQVDTRERLRPHGRAAERRHAAAGRGRRVLAVGRPVRRGDALRHHRHAAAGADQGR